MFPYALASLDDMSADDFETLLQKLQHGHKIPYIKGSFIARLFDHLESSKPDVLVQFLRGLRGRERLAAIATVRHMVDKEAKYDDTLHCGDISSFQSISNSIVEYNDTRMPFLEAMQWHQEVKLHLQNLCQALAYESDRSRRARLTPNVVKKTLSFE